MKFKDSILKTFSPNFEEFYDILVSSDKFPLGSIFRNYISISLEDIPKEEVRLEKIKAALKVVIDFPEYKIFDE